MVRVPIGSFISARVILGRVDGEPWYLVACISQPQTLRQHKTHKLYHGNLFLTYGKCLVSMLRFRQVAPKSSRRSKPRRAKRCHNTPERKFRLDLGISGQIP